MNHRPPRKYRLMTMDRHTWNVLGLNMFANDFQPGTVQKRHRLCQTINKKQILEIEKNTDNYFIRGS